MKLRLDLVIVQIVKNIDIINESGRGQWVMKNKIINFGWLIACAFLITACSLTKDEDVGPPLLNGNWASTDGVYVAELRNGNFRAIANDTGNVLSTGNYVALSETEMRLEWVSEITGSPNKASCKKSNDNQLDCVDQAGKQFSLRRSA